MFNVQFYSYHHNSTNILQIITIDHLSLLQITNLKFEKYVNLVVTKEEDF
jgi:hypothetical protein